MEPSLTPASMDIKARQMVREVENRMENLFMTYFERFDSGGSSQQEASQIAIDVDDDNDFLTNFLVREVATRIQWITSYEPICKRI